MSVADESRVDDVREVAPRALFACCAFRLAVMTPEKLGSLIGAIFGLIFVLANTGALRLGLERCFVYSGSPPS
jgi:hypothetical protein